MPPNTVCCIYSIRRNRELQRRLIYDTEMLNNIPHLLTGKHNILWNGTYVLSFTFQIAKARLTTYFHISLLVVSIQLHCNLTPKHKSQYVLLKPIALVNTKVKVKNGTLWWYFFHQNNRTYLMDIFFQLKSFKMNINICGQLFAISSFLQTPFCWQLF